MTNLENHYDLRAAIEYNGLEKSVPSSFTILAEILSGAHDEGEYFWLIQDDNTELFYVITGSHDYTGWDCQSGANISDAFDDLVQLQLFVPEIDNQNRPVREMIREQVKRLIHNNKFNKKFDKMIKE